jgi:uncharacterized protein (DUF362 family)
MKDHQNVSRRNVIATAVAAGCWGGIPGHAWPEPQPGQTGQGFPAQTTPIPALTPEERKGPVQIDQSGRNQTARAAWTPSDEPNKPMGMGRGVYPGRVVWVHDPKVATWDGVTESNKVISGTGQWWDDANCNQDICTEMMSTAVLNTAGEKSEKKAWELIFKEFNATHGFGNSGYKPGEKIAIKVNFNNDRSNTAQWTPGRGYPSPQMLQAFLRQLVQNAGVPGEDITVFDGASGRFISDPVYNRIMADPDERLHKIHFQVNPPLAARGREPVVADETDPIKFSDPKVGVCFQPVCVVEAKYRISYALLRGHEICGITCCTKNNNGSIYWPARNYWGPSVYHGYITKARGIPAYNAFVDILGHRQIGGKNLLNFIDGLYSGEQSETNVMRWQSMGDHWTSSILMSQDPIAIDSVALDFIRNEPRQFGVHSLYRGDQGHADNWMHEAALVGSAPSGTKYDPGQTGDVITHSLGVHEHWNNATEKKYSRNLGKKEGIELVAISTEGKKAPKGTA